MPRNCSSIEAGLSNSDKGKCLMSNDECLSVSNLVSAKAGAR